MNLKIIQCRETPLLYQCDNHAYNIAIQNIRMMFCVYVKQICFNFSLRSMNISNCKCVRGFFMQRAFICWTINVRVREGDSAACVPSGYTT